MFYLVFYVWKFFVLTLLAIKRLARIISFPVYVVHSSYHRSDSFDWIGKSQNITWWNLTKSSISAHHQPLISGAATKWKRVVIANKSPPMAIGFDAVYTVINSRRRVIKKRWSSIGWFEIDFAEISQDFDDVILAPCFHNLSLTEQKMVHICDFSGGWYTLRSR